MFNYLGQVLCAIKLEADHRRGRMGKCQTIWELSRTLKSLLKEKIRNCNKTDKVMGASRAPTSSWERMLTPLGANAHLHTL